MTSKHRVECKCCGMMMVPKTIFSRGFYGGWGVWLGGGSPLASYCPFCLNEAWDGVKVPVEKSTGAKFALVTQLAFALLVVNGLVTWLLEAVFYTAPGSFIFTASEWALVLIGVAFYQKLKFKSQ